MPVQVYSFALNVGHQSGQSRCVDEAAAKDIYNALSDQINGGMEFVTIKHGEDIHSVRAKEITSFGITVHFEQTQEEIKAEQIRRIESGGYGLNEYTNAGSALIGSSNGILRKY